MAFQSVVFCVAIVLIALLASVSCFRQQRIKSYSTKIAASPFDNLLSGFSNAGKSNSGKVSSVAITGASGLIGSALVKIFEANNVDVIKITTGGARGGKTIKWNPATQTIGDVSALEGVDVVIHLAGENVASGDGPLAIIGRWSDSKKKAILESRVEGTKLIVDSISTLKKKPKAFISASAVGFYGYDDSETIFDESNTKKGKGFLAEVVEAWETEALKANKAGVRTVCLRFAPVFSPKAGILAKLLPIFSLGAGGVLGSGKQGFSWISIDDAVKAVLFAIDNKSLSGPVNVCAPTPVTNADFTKAMGDALSRPVIFPVPEIAAKTLFGEMGEEMLLGGQRVTPTKLTKAGFKYEDTDLTQAIRKLAK